MSESGIPLCNRCRHFYITHELPMRYGCHAFGFKSQALPVRVVAEASSAECRYFDAKPKQT